MDGIVIGEGVIAWMKRFIQILWRFLLEFCDNSNIHGVRYFTERILHWSERLWWIIAFGVSFWLCGSMIRDVWMEWTNHPMKIDLSGETHISAIPFPTVTICPHMRNLKRKLDITSKFNRNLELVTNLSQTEIKQFEALAHICPPLSNLKYKENFTSEFIYNVLEDVAPNLEYTMQDCWWQQQKINCSEHISPVITHHGLCFTFNALNSRDMYTDEFQKRSKFSKNNRNISGWTLENGYEKDFTENDYPVRVLESGRKGALELVLTSYEQDYDYLCNGHLQGFLIYLTVAGNVLEPRNVLFTDFSEDIVISVKPKVTDTSEAIRSYKPHQRQCFFNSDRRLRFFKTYTQTNCNIECRMNLTEKVCGCTKFSMPRDANAKICGPAKIKCYEQATINISDYIHNCKCLVSCSYIEYETEIDRQKLTMNTDGTANESEMSGLGLQQTRLTILFGKDYAKTKIRVETMEWVEFLSDCGGLLGLFLGISLLSIVELIYYSTLRLFWIIRRSKTERNEEQPDSRENDAIQFREHAWMNRNQMIQRLFRIVRNMQTFFIELFDDSNIHGVRYFSERRLHWNERIFWLVTTTVSLWMCGSMIHNVWIQWIEDPLKMELTERSVRMGTIPFPTVTICPEIKTTKHKLDVNAVMNSLTNLSDIEMTRLNALAHVCPLLPNLITFKDNFTSEIIYDTIQDIAPNITDSIRSCYWRDRWVDCSNLLSPILTEDGLCFTFNSLNSDEIYTNEMAPGMMITKNNRKSKWDFENGYTKPSNGEKCYPFQLSYNKRLGALLFVLTTYPRDIEYQCRGCDTGFKIILSLPGETVDTSQNYLRLPASHQNAAIIKTKIIYATPGLRSYTPNQRQCFFKSDHPLRFFKDYAEWNCKSECLANFTRIECGCVKFSMPRDKHTKICGGANVKCYKSAQKKLFTSESGKIFRDACNCLPSCKSIKYYMENQRNEINSTQYHQLRLQKDKEMSIIILKSDKDSSNSMVRKEMYTFGGFLAASGGLLGLFLGVSFLSIIEIIYYATLRLFWTIRMKRNDH